MQNRMFFVLLRPIFCEKWKIVPPIRKKPPLKRLNLRNWKKNHSEFWRRPFFFGDFGRKKPLNFGFRPKNHSEFWRRPFFFFFFWRSRNFGRKKPLNFRAFRDISSQFSDNRLKLIQDPWKFESRSFAHFSLFQNSPPFSKSWLRACIVVMIRP